MDNKLLSIMLPGYDRNLYEISKHEIVDNEDTETNRFYKKKLLITIEEKNIFPKELGNHEHWYAHGFGTPIEYDDFPTRTMTTGIILKTKRWKNKITGETASKKLDSIFMEGTRSPEDLVSFLKYGDRARIICM